MNKMLDHGETRVIKPGSKPSPFVSAAGMVLGVGFSVLGLIAKGIKGAAGLLVNRKPERISRVGLESERNAPGISDVKPDPTFDVPGV